MAVTLHGYRSRFLASEPLDPRYEVLARRLAETERIGIPTLMIQGGDDRCDEPAGSANQDRWFTGGDQRIVLEGVGHFPHREAPEAVAQAIDQHLGSARPD